MNKRLSRALGGRHFGLCALGPALLVQLFIASADFKLTARCLRLSWLTQEADVLWSIGVSQDEAHPSAINKGKGAGSPSSWKPRW